MRTVDDLLISIFLSVRIESGRQKFGEHRTKLSDRLWSPTVLLASTSSCLERIVVVKPVVSSQY